MALDRINDNRCYVRVLELLQIMLLSLSVAGLCYVGFYLLAPWIWSQNIPYRPENITKWVLEATSEHDGVEIFALYILVFISSFTALALSGLIRLIKSDFVRKIVFAVSAVLAGIYCLRLGFHPPMSSYISLPFSTLMHNSLPLVPAVSLVLAFLLYLQRKSPRLMLTVVVITLVPVCFVAVSPISKIDYSYIFAPALRLINGAPLRDIYFQYDLLPSLLAAVWMKLGLPLDSFQLLGQLAYYIAILGVFILSGKLFHSRELPLFLLIVLVLSRVYASPWDYVLCFQVAPIRLDLWLPLLFVIYKRGAHHWSAGLVCGLLILLMKNMGIIYTLAYIQLLIALYVLRYMDGDRRISLLHDLRDYGRQCTLPLAIIILCYVASFLLFKNSEYPNYAGYYQKIGIGFIRISEFSFYWYIFALISTATILLFRMRCSVSSTYLTSALMLIFCAIGNSIYFFGRSHEHNIINLSIVLAFLCFLALDLIFRSFTECSSTGRLGTFICRYGAVAAAAVIVLMITVLYSDNIKRKMTIQTTRIAAGKLSYPPVFDPAIGHQIEKIREVTNNSRKLYFLDLFDFELYYYGGYKPVGYCNPFQSWIFTKDLHNFIQEKLDNGYYLVFDSDMTYLMANLRYNYVNFANDYIVLALLNNKVPKP